MNDRIYIATIHWPNIGDREYKFFSMASALEMMAEIKDAHPNIKCNLKSEKGGRPVWVKRNHGCIYV